MGRTAHRRAVFLRRRLAALALVTALGLLVVALLGERSTAAPGPTTDGPVMVVVARGDTVWDVALRHAPDGVDPTVYVAEVVAANGVDARALVPGSVLRLPGT